MVILAILFALFTICVASPLPCVLNWGPLLLTGAVVGDACRYTVRYGEAQRWEYAARSTKVWAPAALPPMCPQSNPMVSALDQPQGQSEDCLFMVIYTPRTIVAPLPIFFWIHGGSFVTGSVTDSGLTGQFFAPQENVVTVFVQYRLGILGYLPPPNAPTTADPNLGLSDVILALQVLRSNIGFVGDKEQVTVGGQSAGASMVRALWGAPAAKGHFHRIVMQSDPINFGTASPTDTAALQSLVYSDRSLGCQNDYACLKALDVRKLLAVQDDVAVMAPAVVTSIPTGEVYRPQFGTPTLPQDPTNALFYSPDNLGLRTIPIMFTTMHNEGGHIANSAVPGPVPWSKEYYAAVIDVFLQNQKQTDILVNSGKYPVDHGPDGLRVSLDAFFTTVVWRCPTRTVASQWAAAGGRGWVAEWTVGKSYTFNQGGYCAQTGAACHSDDIYEIFGDGSPNVALFSAFIHNGDPGWAQWSSNSSTADVHNFGNVHPIPDCPTGEGVFGTTVPYMWQAYSNGTAWTGTSTVAPSKTPCAR